jgi:uncharacterized protein DUF4252
MKRCLLAAVLLFAASPVLAQVESAQLKLPNFDHLRQYAKDSVNITLGTWPLGIAAWVMNDDDTEQAEVKALLRGLKAVHVRSFEFDTDFVYSEQDIEAVRSQLTAPGWSRLVEVRNRKENKSVDMYIALDGNHANGLAIVASEPRKFTILNIVGHIDLDKLGKLEDRLGLPRLGVESETIARSE